MSVYAWIIVLTTNHAKIAWNVEVGLTLLFRLYWKYYTIYYKYINIFDIE